MQSVMDYLPEIMIMSPSIAIAVVYLALTLCASIFLGLDKGGEFDRMLLMVILTGTILGISLSIGGVLQKELPESLVLSDAYNLTIHEEFLIALCVEMAGAIIFVPAIYGSDLRPRPIYRSMGIALFFLFLFFIFPVGIISKEIFSTSPAIIDNYIDNIRVELLSLIVLFFAYSIYRITGLIKNSEKRKRGKELFYMMVVITVFVIIMRHQILEPQYENLYLAITAAGLSVFVIAMAKIHETVLIIIILASMLLSGLLLTGTQIADFSLHASTSINLVAELIGAITVALILDTELEV